jgi:hypothetical protein
MRMDEVSACTGRAEAASVAPAVAAIMARLLNQSRGVSEGRFIAARMEDFLC